jgi:hypothetical protein
MKRVVHAIPVVLCSALISISQANAVVFDLSGDWSDAGNPSGPWAYRVGTTLLPHTASWTAGVSYPVAQPAYQPQNVTRNFLPAWYKATSVPALFDNQIGDVIVHTNDNSNGNEGLGPANVLFTVPVAGSYDIFGNLWNASTALVPSDFRPRPQDWRLLVNGSVMASGNLSGLPGEFTHDNPQFFDLPLITLSVGDTVQLDVFRGANAAAGFFVGTNLTLRQVETTQVSEPASLSLVAFLATLLLFGRRRTEGSKG